MLARSLILLFSLTACSGPQITGPRRLPADPVAAVQRTAERALVAAEAAVDPSILTCEEVEPGLLACPTEAHLANWAWSEHLIEPEEQYLAAPLTPPDPVEIQEGLAIYEDLLHSVVRRTRSQLDLWEHTPVLSAQEIYYFQDHPEVWEAAVEFRRTPAGRQRRDRFRSLVEELDGDHDALRHLALRDGFFYFEDPRTADWAADHLGLRDLFDDPELELERAGRRYALERGRGGHYYYADPELDRYRVRLTLFDRVGRPDELTPTAGYRLIDLRRRLGLDHIEVGPETGSGRSAEVVFLSGEEFAGQLVRIERGVAQVGVLGTPDDVRHALARSRVHAVVIYGLVDTAFTMVRENLFFDEPANEVGQQDGIMRLAFVDAFRNGQTQYTVNEVTYSVYDDSGRPRPPQVCIDYVTDAVERFSGRWWPEEGNGGGLPSDGNINIRDYMRYRQVRRLVQLAESLPHIASLLTFKREERVPFREREDFFQNLWKHRDDIRIADVVVIYGLRSDGRNHYHAFYVYDTDPVFGAPITVTDQAGHARIRSWTSIMSNAPRRFVRNIVRWNPSWILHPESVELAGYVREGAVRVARALGGDEAVPLSETTTELRATLWQREE